MATAAVTLNAKVLDCFSFLSSSPRSSCSMMTSSGFNYVPLLYHRNKTKLSYRVSAHISNSHSKPPNATSPSFPPPKKGTDILIEALEREGVTTVFADAIGSPKEIQSAFAGSSVIRSIRIPYLGKEGLIFAAEGYARSSGKVGVCIIHYSTDGLYRALQNAKLDGVPVVAIIPEDPTGFGNTLFANQCPSRVKKYSEYLVASTRIYTKESLLIFDDANDIPRMIKEAFVLAASGRPGPVLIYIAEYAQHQVTAPNWNTPIKVDLPGYMSMLPKSPNESRLSRIVDLIFESRKPVLCVGDGCLNLADELNTFVELTGIPVAGTFMGLGSFPVGHDLSLRMFGIHGTSCANYAMDNCDLVLAFGVSFDHRLTGKLQNFAKRAKVVLVNFDPAEMEKYKHPDVSVCAELKLALEGINSILESRVGKDHLDFSAWRRVLREQKVEYPTSFKTSGETILPQYAIEMLDELTDGEAIVSTCAGQHQIWAAQFYKYRRPRQLLTSGEMGAMHFALSAAVGAAFANPDAIVVVIDKDVCSIRYPGEDLETICKENLSIKIMHLNNQQHSVHKKISQPLRSSKIPTAHVTRKDDVRAAIRKMLDTPGPYILDVIVPNQELGPPSNHLYLGLGRFDNTKETGAGKVMVLHEEPFYNLGVLFRFEAKDE